MISRNIAIYYVHTDWSSANCDAITRGSHSNMGADFCILEQWLYLFYEIWELISSIERDICIIYFMYIIEPSDKSFPTDHSDLIEHAVWVSIEPVALSIYMMIVLHGFFFWLGSHRYYENESPTKSSIEYQYGSDIGVWFGYFRSYIFSDLTKPELSSSTDNFCYIFLIYDLFFIIPGIKIFWKLLILSSFENMYSIVSRHIIGFSIGRDVMSRSKSAGGSGRHFFAQYECLHFELSSISW